MEGYFVHNRGDGIGVGGSGKFLSVCYLGVKEVPVEFMISLEISAHSESNLFVRVFHCFAVKNYNIQVPGVSLYGPYGALIIVIVRKINEVPGFDIGLI